jgi:hypothetical protein
MKMLGLATFFRSGHVSRSGHAFSIRPRFLGPATLSRSGHVFSVRPCFLGAAMLSRSGHVLKGHEFIRADKPAE